MRFKRREVGMRGRSGREQQKYIRKALRSYHRRNRIKLVRNFLALLVFGTGVGIGVYLAPMMLAAFQAYYSQETDIESPVKETTGTVPPTATLPPTPGPTLSDTVLPTPAATPSTPLVPTRLSVPQIFALYDAGKLTIEEARALLPKREASEPPVDSTPSLQETITPSPPVTSIPATSQGSEYSNSRVYVKGAYIVGAQWNPIILRNDPQATNPSWTQLKSFLRNDPTDKRKYDYSSFVCADFAEMLHNNAERAGIRAAYVSIELGPAAYRPTSEGHALVAFETTDRGMVFIDSTAPIEGGLEADKIVDLKEGRDYIPESIFPEPGWSSTWGNMGKVLEIETIQW